MRMTEECNRCGIVMVDHINFDSNDNFLCDACLKKDYRELQGEIADLTAKIEKCEDEYNRGYNEAIDLINTKDRPCLRLQVAMTAMQGILGSGTNLHEYDGNSEFAIKHADALIKAEEESR